jgi:pimeloyl-ACP methyl ester carboxylesterase
VETEPFSIAIEEGVLSDLRDRIRATRWPPPSPEAPWQQGADLGYLRELLADWAVFDWSAQEERLNAVEHFRADVDGVRIHYVHVPGGGTPLILTHGWPSTFVEHLQLVPYLRERFDLVIPSLPGYGFSERPARNTTRDTARCWHRLMQGLGYTRYGAQGGDFGASVTTHMALEDPEPLIGIHLHQIDDRPPSTDSPTAAEREYLAAVEAWDAVERGYSSIQSTKPQTVAYGLNDSPAGLAAWIVEKWRSWSDDLAAIDRDVLLTNLTLFWATQTIATSMRDYYDMRRHRPAIQGPVRVPTGVALFANELVSEGTPPREWGERLYGDLRRWTPMPRGGHFAPAEQPELLAHDITEFFDDL